MKQETYQQKLNEANADLDTLYVARSVFLRRESTFTYEAKHAFEAIEKSIAKLEAAIVRYEKFAAIQNKAASNR